MMSSRFSVYGELIVRYVQVIKLSWHSRKKLEPEKRNAQEREFLPALLEVVDSPPSLVGRAILWVIMGFLVLSMVWSVYGEVDIVAVANGKVIPSGRSKVVQPLDPGVIKQIHVKEGQTVQAGELLIELDPTLKQADLARVSEGYVSAQIEAERYQALLDALVGKGRAVLKTSLQVSPTLLQSQQAALDGELAEFRARNQSFEAEVAKRKVELQSVKEVVSKLQSLLPLAKSRADDVKRLRNEGYVSEHGMLDREQIRIETERELALQLSRVKEVEAAIFESSQRQAALFAETTRTAKTALAEAQKRAAQLRWEKARENRLEQLTRLVSPIAGTVQQLAVSSEGGVVTPAQSLMIVVPNEAQTEVEGILQNKDIGFVRIGDFVTVKVDTYPYVRFGTLSGTVSSLSRDAIVDEKGNATFMVRVRLNSDALSVDNAKLRLSPGMTVVAEIKTGKRTVLSYVLDPVKQASQEGLRER